MSHKPPSMRNKVAPEIQEPKMDDSDKEFPTLGNSQKKVYVPLDFKKIVPNLLKKPEEEEKEEPVHVNVLPKFKPIRKFVEKEEEVPVEEKPKEDEWTYVPYKTHRKKKEIDWDKEPEPGLEEESVWNDEAPHETTWD